VSDPRVSEPTVTDAFIDTNVLLYAASTAPEEAAKAKVACTLIESSRFAVSVQILQEFYVNGTGKLARKIPTDRLELVLALLRQRRVEPLTMELFEEALRIRARFQLSYWDAAVVAAAKRTGAKLIYSEDLAHGQFYDGVQVVNPFLGVPTS